MLKITRQTDYGVVLLTRIAQGPCARIHTARDLSAESEVPLPTVSKILKLLARAEILESLRGVKGGYRLSRDAESITVADVITAIEGPIAITECVETAAGDCDKESWCPVRSNWQLINDAVQGALEKITLARMARPFEFLTISALSGDEAEGVSPMKEPLVADKSELDLQEVADREYQYGFVTDIEADALPPGLSEDIVREISRRKNEPEWLLEYRLKAYSYWRTMKEPDWAFIHYPPVDYENIIYYSAPKPKKELQSLDEVDPELLETFDKLGIPLLEQKRLSGVAVDAVFDSVSVATTFKGKLAELGIIFCSFSEAVHEHPELIQKWLGSVVPHTDNFFASLNAAVFSDGSFCYIPEGVRCPMELSTYFRINSAGTGQFERTLIVAEKGSSVSYLEGCTAPMRDENQLHAAVVELIALDDAQIKYSTVQNWYPGNKEGKGGIYNFVTKRGACRGDRSKISWTQVETGSAITWKYPSCLLQGDDSVGEFYSVALTNNYQQADTGTKMVHSGKNTRSTIVSKGISAGRGQNTYRGLVEVKKNAEKARNYSQCDSMLLGDRCGAHTFPYIEVKNPTAHVEHEATTSKIGEDQIFYCNQRGISTEDAVSMIVNGFCKEVFRELPMEFAVEAQKLLAVSLEGSVG